MDHATKARFFIWNTVLNAAILILWTIMLSTSADFVYELHSKFIAISRENFNIAIYCLLGVFKILFIVFNLVPLIAFSIVKKKGSGAAS